jgi:hypothetical protein
MAHLHFEAALLHPTTNSEWPRTRTLGEITVKVGHTPPRILSHRNTSSEKCDRSYRLFDRQRQVSLSLIRLHQVNATVARRWASW